MQLFKECAAQRMDEATETWEAWIIRSTGGAHGFATVGCWCSIGRRYITIKRIFNHHVDFYLLWLQFLQKNKGFLSLE